jgi:inosine/xanthosine triphosphatase
MTKIVVASKNPVKIEAVKVSFAKFLQNESPVVQGVDVLSGVSDQPFGNQETLLGAKNRAHNAMLEIPEADFWVGIEGGIEQDNFGLAAYAWVCVRSRTKMGISKSGTFYLPQKVADLIHTGMELGEADDAVFGRQNSKQSDGAVGILTNRQICRVDLYAHAVTLALIPFIHPEYYPENLV